MVASRIRPWVLRLLVLIAIAILCLAAGSASPAFGFAVAWGPNYPFLGAVIVGALRLPRALDPVHPLEPTLYRLAGVGLVKQLVTTREWHALVGLEPPPKPVGCGALLDQVELFTKGAEACHAAAFLFASCVMLFCLWAGWSSAAVWILIFNIALNAYPIMLQRTNRWRVRRARAGCR